MKEEQLREDQRREALARSREEPGSEETLPPPVQAPEAPVAAREAAGQRARSRSLRSRCVRSQCVRSRSAEPGESRSSRRSTPKALLESAGLVMIETDRSKAPAAPRRAEEPPHLGRPRRERPKPPAQDDELQQVETKR